MYHRQAGMAELNFEDVREKPSESEEVRSKMATAVSVTVLGAGRSHRQGSDCWGRDWGLSAGRVGI